MQVLEVFGSLFVPQNEDKAATSLTPRAASGPRRPACYQLLSSKPLCIPTSPHHPPWFWQRQGEDGS